MQGSAKKNLFMFKKLCGNDVLQNVILVSTMWEIVNDSDGNRREKELMDTEEFWGVLIRNGAKFERYNNTRDSAMRLLKQFVKSGPVTMSIQKEMVTEHKTLDQTQAGIELEAEFQKEREKFKKELAEAQEMMKEALDARDQESAQLLHEHQAEMTRRIDKIVQEREELKISMEKMHSERFAKLEKQFHEQQARLRQQEKENALNRKKEEETKEILDLLRQQQMNAEKEKDILQNQLIKTKELMETLPAVQTQTEVQYRTRSTPGPNRIDEYANVTLSGSYYYFTGPACDYQ